jgi:hypothetical protein
MLKETLAANEIGGRGKVIHTVAGNTDAMRQEGQEKYHRAQ